MQTVADFSVSVLRGIPDNKPRHKLQLLYKAGLEIVRVSEIYVQPVVTTDWTEAKSQLT